MLVEHINTIIISIISLITSVFGGALIRFILLKTKIEKVNNITEGAIKTVFNAICYVNQIYVDAIKGTDLGDEKTMDYARNLAITYVSEHLSTEAKKLIESQNKNIEQGIAEQIEIAIQSTK